MGADANTNRRVRPGRATVLAAVAVVSALGARAWAADAPQVALRKLPFPGVQPQAAVGPDGTVHVVFLTGDPAASDVRYTRLGPGTDEFTPPVRVNSQPGSAVAKGTIRGAQVAVGRGGRVHVVWNGSTQARPENPAGGQPLLYSRSDPARTAFEPQRNLMGKTSALDGGATVAADPSGHVLVAWHARPEGAAQGEANRRLFAARSDDDGATFAPESPALESATGACPCCGTRALMTPGGSTYVLFRAAVGGLDRDLYLAASSDRGGHFRAARLHPWRVNMCPMSSESLAATDDPAAGVVAAWETQGQVYVSRLKPGGDAPTPPAHPRGAGGNRKHPAVALNRRGQFVLAWAEDTSFTRGGSLAWRVFDADGRPTEAAGRVEGGIPHYGLPTAVARPDGTFLVIH